MQAVLLTLGRLVVVLEQDERLLSPALPLISDSAFPGAAAGIAACAFHVLATISASSAGKGHRW